MKPTHSVANILIVDDSKDICFLLANHFKSKGFAVETAESGLDAWKIISKEHFEIIISDIIMPGMKGTELLQKIKHHYPMMYVIMITGYVSLEHLLTCMRFGADTCIFKPMDNFRELDSAVERALASKHQWEEKIVALNGLKEPATHGLEYQNDRNDHFERQKDTITIET
jgi:DNA-binding NtrC family response regulator